MIPKHTCEELGVCQQRAECHLPCDDPPGRNRYPFAPGVIDCPAPVGKGGWIADLVAVVIALGAVAAVVGFAVGYMPRGVL